MRRPDHNSGVVGAGNVATQGARIVNSAMARGGALQGNMRLALEIPYIPTVLPTVGVTDFPLPGYRGISLIRNRRRP